MLEVGIPVYHSKKTLPLALDSLVAQTSDNFCVSIYIDGDGEDYSDILSTYRARGLKIKLIKSEENHGCGYARQQILDMTECDYITFLDSDDLFYPRAVEVLYNQAVRKDLDILTTDFAQEEADGLIKIAQAKERCCTWFHGVSYKVSFLREKGIRHDPYLVMEEDANFNIVAYNSTKKIGMLGEVTYLWRENSDSFTRQDGKENYYKRSCAYYIYSQVEGMKSIVRINKSISLDFMGKTLAAIYRYYMLGRFYKIDMTLPDQYLSTLKEEEWFQNYLNDPKNKKAVIDFVKCGDDIDGTGVYFYEETYSQWVCRLLKKDGKY